MIALSSPALSLLPFDKAIAIVAQDFGAWEIVGEYRHRLPDIEKEFFDLSRSYRLEYSVHAPLSDINIGSANPALRRASLDEVLAAMSSCRRMGIDRITVHPAFLTPITLLDRSLAVRLMQESLQEIDRASEEHGVIAALENMPRMPTTICTGPEELLSAIEGTSLQICFDIGHANTNGNIGAFLPHWRRFANIHIHDNDGSTDQHLTIGDGAIDFIPVVRALKGYRHRYVIEARRLDGASTSKERLQRMLGDA